MRTVLVLLVLVVAAPALAQTHPWPGYETDPAYIAERHRAADAALRARLDEQAAFAQRQQLDARLTRMELRAARQALPQPLPSPLDRPAPLPSARQNDAIRRGVSEIDNWLYRQPDR